MCNFPYSVKKNNRSLQGNYKFYPLYSDKVRAEIKRNLVAIGYSKQEARRSVWQSTWLRWVNDKHIASTKICEQLVYLEHQWLGQPITFVPESADLIRRLLRTNFQDVIENRSLAWPYSVATLAMPSQYQCGGSVLQGCLFAYLTKKEQALLADKFYSLYGDDEAKVSQVNTDNQYTRELIFSYPNPLQANSTIATKVREQELVKILHATSIDEFRGYMGIPDARGDNANITMTEQQCRIQFELLRALAAFMVYISLEPGTVEDACKAPPEGWHTEHSKIIRILDYQPTNSIGDGKSKCPHYRRYKHEKYYKKQYADWPLGTRWTTVNFIPKIVRQH